MNTKYNYEEEVIASVKDYILENYTKEEIKSGLDEDVLYDEMFISDSVTGNASGSFTFNGGEAEENLCHNMELLAEALEYFNDDASYLKRGAEACDVTIRCYLLGNSISIALKEISY